MSKESPADCASSQSPFVNTNYPNARRRPSSAQINVANDKSERETDRKLKAHSPSANVNFDLVVLEGKLKLHNYEKRTAEIVITNPIPGKPITADQQDTVSVNPTKLRLLDREARYAGRLSWNPAKRKR